MLTSQQNGAKAIREKNFSTLWEVVHATVNAIPTQSAL